MKLVLDNKKTKLNIRLNNRTQEISSKYFVLVSVNLSNWECIRPLKVSRNILFLLSETRFIFKFFETNLVFMSIALMLFGNPPILIGTVLD